MYLLFCYADDFNLSRSLLLFAFPFWTPTGQSRGAPSGVRIQKGVSRSSLLQLYSLWEGFSRSFSSDCTKRFEEPSDVIPRRANKS